MNIKDYKKKYKKKYKKIIKRSIKRNVKGVWNSAKKDIAKIPDTSVLKTLLVIKVADAAHL